MWNLKWRCNALKSFHWPFLKRNNPCQFTLALASFASRRYCYLQFQYLSAFYRILSAKHLTSLTNPFCFIFSASVASASASLVSSRTHFFCVHASSVKLIGFLALQDASSLFQNRAENLFAINRKTEFPHFSLTLPISKILPGFLKNSQTFPWPWQPCVRKLIKPHRLQGTLCLHQNSCHTGEG